MNTIISFNSFIDKKNCEELSIQQNKKRTKPNQIVLSDFKISSHNFIRKENPKNNETQKTNLVNNDAPVENIGEDSMHYVVENSSAQTIYIHHRQLLSDKKYLNVQEESKEKFSQNQCRIFLKSSSQITQNNQISLIDQVQQINRIDKESLKISIIIQQLSIEIEHMLKKIDEFDATQKMYRNKKSALFSCLSEDEDENLNCDIESINRPLSSSIQLKKDAIGQKRYLKQKRYEAERQKTRQSFLKSLDELQQNLLHQLENLTILDSKTSQFDHSSLEQEIQSIPLSSESQPYNYSELYTRELNSYFEEQSSTDSESQNLNDDF